MGVFEEDGKEEGRYLMWYGGTSETEEKREAQKWRTAKQRKKGDRGEKSKQSGERKRKQNRRKREILVRKRRSDLRHTYAFEIQSCASNS